MQEVLSTGVLRVACDIWKVVVVAVSVVVSAIGKGGARIDVEWIAALQNDGSTHLPTTSDAADKTGCPMYIGHLIVPDHGKAVRSVPVRRTVVAMRVDVGGEHLRVIL